MASLVSESLRSFSSLYVDQETSFRCMALKELPVYFSSWKNVTEKLDLFHPPPLLQEGVELSQMAIERKCAENSDADV